MPVAPYRPADLRRRVFRGSAMVAAGRLSPRQLRGPAWQRLFRDVYADVDVTVTHELRAVAAARLVVPGAVVTGRSAGVLWGLPVAERDDDVEVTVPPGSNVTRLPGIRVRRRTLAADHVTLRRGVRTTTAESTAVDLARTATLDDAVVLVDQLVVGRMTSLDLIRAAAEQASGGDAVRSARRSPSQTGWPDPRRRRDSGCCCTARTCRGRSRSTSSATVRASSHGSTSAGRTRRSPSSTRASGTGSRRSGSPRTGVG